jgi:hypothetical protein
MKTKEKHLSPGYRFESDWNDEKMIDLLAGPESPLIVKNHPLELVLGASIRDYSSMKTDYPRYQAHRVVTPAARRHSGIRFGKKREEETLSLQHHRRL